MTDYGMMQGQVCELLHCSFSELPERCKQLIDYEFAAEYLNRKAEEQQRGMKI